MFSFYFSSFSSHKPLNTYSAEPVIYTGLSIFPSHSTLKVPPGRFTSTLLSSKSFKIPATTLAQLPVPQAKVIPQPLSQTSI